MPSYSSPPLEPTNTPMPTSAPAMPAPIGIAANQGWQDAYQFVHPGDKLEITAAGVWSHDPLDPQFSTLYGPSGVDLFEAKAILPSAPVGSLIGRIGDNHPFLVAEHLVLTSAERGKLWLSMNDSPDRFSDNTGSVGATVLFAPKPVGPGVRLTSTQDSYTLVYPAGYFVVITPQGICLTQDARAEAIPCDLVTATGLEVGEAHGRTGAQLANELINFNDPNFRFDSHEMLLDGEPAIWISREGNEEIMNLVIAVQAHRVYTWRFFFPVLHPALGQEDQVMAELDQQQMFYNTIINSFEFLD